MFRQWDSRYPHFAELVGPDCYIDARFQGGYLLQYVYTVSAYKGLAGPTKAWDHYARVGDACLRWKAFQPEHIAWTYV